MTLNRFEISNRKGKTTNAFSLIELLTVLTVMSIMVAISTSIFNEISNNQNMGQVANTLGATLESARNTAMAHNTYVWVGFVPQTDASGNTIGLDVAAVESLTGQSTDLGVPANLRATMKARVIANVALKSGMSLPGMDTTAADVVDVMASSLPGSFTASVSGVTQTFSRVIQFSPQGETIAQVNLVQWVNVGLQPIRGQQNNLAALQISGTTGEVRLFQP